MTDSMENQVRARVHLASSPGRVYDVISTDSGRRAFWAESTQSPLGAARFSNTPLILKL